VRDDRAVPNCYYVVSSEPEQTGNDIARCGARHGGRPKFIGRFRGNERYVGLIWYRTLEEAEENLDKIKGCLEDAGHTVHHHDIIEDITELGVTVEGYEPDP
jgi:hypothetical protein